MCDCRSPGVPLRDAHVLTEYLCRDGFLLEILGTLPLQLTSENHRERCQLSSGNGESKHSDKN